MPTTSERKMISATEQRQVIHFEDRGQDFLRWTVERGVVIESSGQAWLWTGTKVLSVPIVGRQLKILTPQAGAKPVFLNYKVTQIDAAKPLPAAHDKSQLLSGRAVRRHPRGMFCSRYRE